MTTTNHALTGAFLVVTIDKPYIALPAALLSHFALDVLPHWNHHLPREFLSRSMLIKIDIVLTLLVLLFFAVANNESPLLAVAGGFLALLPDFIWLPEVLQNREVKMTGKSYFYSFRRWHHSIQKSETVSGLLVEAVWFFVFLGLLIFKDWS